MSAQDECDWGQEAIERELSRAQVAFDQFVAEKRAILADYTAQVFAAPKAERLELELKLSIEFANWHREHEVPRPVRQGVYQPLALVGRGDYRSGPLTDG